MTAPTIRRTKPGAGGGYYYLHRAADGFPSDFYPTRNEAKKALTDWLKSQRRRPAKGGQ